MCELLLKPNLKEEEEEEDCGRKFKNQPTVAWFDWRWGWSTTIHAEIKGSMEQDHPADSLSSNICSGKGLVVL